MTNPGRTLLLALGCSLPCGNALADRSLLLDPGEAYEAGACELEIATERRSSRASPPERESALQLDCGIGWHTELTATVARRWGEDFRDQGFAIEGKTALGACGPPGLAWSVEYGLAAERGGGAGWRRSEQYVTLAATLRPADAWAIEARAGAAHDHAARQNTTLWSLTVEHELSDAFEVKLEWAGDDRGASLLGAELRWEFWPDRARLNLFYGGQAGQARERLLGLGLTFEF